MKKYEEASKDMDDENHGEHLITVNSRREKIEDGD